MNKKYIRHPLLSGYRSISGIWFPCDWFDESVRITLLIKYWQTGCQAYRFSEGDLLCFTEKKTIDCALLDGWPLTLYGNTYSSAPLEADEIKRLPVADAWIIRNGLVTALSFSHARVISLADYIDLDDYSFQVSDDFSALFVIETKPNDFIERDVRDVIGGNIPAASQAQQQFVQTLASHENKNGDKKQFNERGSVEQASLMQRILSSLISSKTRNAISDVQNQQAIAQLPKLQRWLAKLAIESSLTSLIGRQHANYINKMMKMFEENNIEQALRHGIPLSKDQDLNDPPSSPYLGFLQGRGSLEIQSSNRVSKGIYLGEEAQQYLKQLYRRQFIQLDKAGRNDEALFILAELLQEHDEALDYLERFERYQQAAELACLWSMPPERITRLYCLSGNIDAAINYARLHHTFSSVILQLQDKHLDIATRMRHEWAEFLADSGDWLQAVDVIWSLNSESTREQAKDWLMKAYRAGGQLTIGAIVKWAILLPETFSQCDAIIEPILNQPDLVHERILLVREILSEKQQNIIINRIANQLIRPIIADQFRGNETLKTEEIKALINRSTDKLLKNDIPKSAFPKIEENSFDTQKNIMSISLPNHGDYAIYDAVSISDQCYLIALGELGVALVKSTGKMVWHKPIPTHQIVISDNQQIVLLLAPRSQYYQIYQLTIATQTVLKLGMLKLSAFANSFDGLFWTLSLNNTVQVVNVKNNFNVVWHVDALNGDVLNIQRTATHEYWLISGENRQCWCYSLPERRLVNRSDVPYHINNVDIFLNKNLDSYYTIDDDKVTLSHFNFSYNQILQLPKVLSIEEKNSFKLISQAGILMEWQQSSTSTTLFHFYTKRYHRCLELNWPTDAKPNVRVEMTNWLLFDREGRMVHIDWPKGKINSFSLRLTV